MENTHQKRLSYVNTNFGNLTRGKDTSNKAKAKLLKRLWKEAKRKYK